MEEIKVGEYVRTTDGYIAKLIEFKDRVAEFDGYITTKYGEEYQCLWDEELSKIKKYSPNIIDLIEVGDYVNGYKVRATYLDGEKHYIKLDVLDDIRVYDMNIKSIVTHEQFNSIKYEVI